MSRVFISYRHDDSSADATLIYQHLKASFDRNLLFIDMNMDGGVKFLPEIMEAINQSNALIAVIGKRWLDVSDENGKRRLDNDKDILRMEIATALNKDMRGNTNPSKWRGDAKGRRTSR